ncbi:MAG TPA: MarR family transcriptional regulator [Capsulimonadaceae bacterium]
MTNQSDDRLLIAEIERSLTVIAERLTSPTSGPIFDLPLSHMKCVHLVASSPGLRLVDLAKAVGMALPAASRAIDKLVRQDIIRREADTQDRRALRLYLTDAARVTLDGAMEQRASELGEWIGSLSPSDREAVRIGLGLLAAAPPKREN